MMPQLTVLGAATLLTGLGFVPALCAQEATSSSTRDSTLDATVHEAPVEVGSNILDAEAKEHLGLSVKGPNGNIIHIRRPPHSNAPRAREADAVPPTTSNVEYHGGPVMTTAVIYTIFWIPSNLQNGAPTSMSKAYMNLQNRFFADYPGHGIDNNNTQYYQVVNGVTTYAHNRGTFAGKNGTFTDTSPYPASGCTDSVTPGNCITDAQVQAEIQNVIASQGWPSGGLTNVYMLFTSNGEGSCFDSTSTACAFTEFCSYHSYAGTETSPIIYANLPYGDTSICQDSNTPSPNNNPDADTSIANASHELTESITDPLSNAWWGSGGNEIADDCYDGIASNDYSPNTWDGGLANQQWNGHYYEIQGMWNNHTSQCAQVGP